MRFHWSAETRRAWLALSLSGFGLLVAVTLSAKPARWSRPGIMRDGDGVTVRWPRLYAYAGRVVKS